METSPYHSRLHLMNFTVFEDAVFEFSRGINAFIGENGTGKTHLMKALYAYQLSCYRQKSVDSFLGGVFQTQNIGELVRAMAGHNSIADVSGTWNDRDWHFAIQGAVFPSTNEETYHLVENGVRPKMPRPVFLPAVDMMGHTRRFLSTFDEYQIDFDLTHRDIVALLLSPERRDQALIADHQVILSSILGGEIEEENERFYLRTKEGRQPMPLVAEGIRKIATLYQLLRNGHLKAGSTLFWDEPEVNINPKLMDEIVSVLLMLARSGVQILLATHSYVILKELDLQATASDDVRYFVLARSENGTTVHATDDYSHLTPNPIADQFDSLYDRQLQRSTGRKRLS
jgi:ABC-type hemin transport system ATPase subunit